MQLTCANKYTTNQAHCLKIAQIFSHAIQPTSCLKRFDNLSILRICIRGIHMLDVLSPAFTVPVTY